MFGITSNYIQLNRQTLMCLSVCVCNCNEAIKLNKLHRFPFTRIRIRQIVGEQQYVNFQAYFLYGIIKLGHLCDNVYEITA